MTDKLQKIREELERLKEETSIGLSEHENGIEQGRMEIINTLSIFLDSIQEEPVSEDYKNALNTEAITFLQEQQIVPNFYADIIVKAVKHGANWQKKQLVAKAIDAQCFGFQGAALFSFRLPSDKYLVGSNVKVIVIKDV